MDKFRVWTLSDLLFRWNTVTNPAKLRSDDEHAECRREALELMAEIDKRARRGIDYHESDHTGRLLLGHR